MNKQELIKQAEKLQAELDILKEKIEKCDDENVRKRVNPPNMYYHIRANGMVFCSHDHGETIENFRFSVGNYFKTKQEAIDYKENMLTKQKLKDLALRLNNGVEIDWENDFQHKYCIWYNSITKKLSQSKITRTINIGSIPCLSKKFLTIAGKVIGEEAIIKLIKSEV